MPGLPCPMDDWGIPDTDNTDDDDTYGNHVHHFTIIIPCFLDPFTISSLINQAKINPNHTKKSFFSHFSHFLE